MISLPRVSLLIANSRFFRVILSLAILGVFEERHTFNNYLALTAASEVLRRTARVN